MRFAILSLTILSILISMADASEGAVLYITKFSNDELATGELLEWKTHKGICRKISPKVNPVVMEIDGRQTIYVNANDSGSITFRPVNRDARKYPYLNWDWKVSNIMPDSREKEVGGDDYPVAVCIVYCKTIFGIPYKYRILIYVYASNIAIGESFTNPCEKKARMIVVQSGKDDVGDWLDYKVNHYHDYIQEFGQEPYDIIYVGIQANAGRTHGKVEVWYSDIFLSSE